MTNIPGSIGTGASIGLRLGQAIFSSSSLFYMGVGFNHYVAFCFLVTVMTIAVPWSFTLALLDIYSIVWHCPLRHSKLLHVVIVGDSIFSVMTLAAASSTASVVDFLLQTEYVSFCHKRRCSRYQISALLALMSWFLSITSSLTNLWLLPTL